MIYKTALYKNVFKITKVLRLNFHSCCFYFILFHGKNNNYQDLLELTPKKDVLFIIGDWNAKVGSQETPGVTGKFGLGIWNEAGQRLIEFCQENALVIANILFQQHKRRLHMDITRWSISKSDWLYSLSLKREKGYTVSKIKTRSWLWIRSWTP